MRTLALIISLGLSFTLGVHSPVMADTVQLRDDAPDRHVVVKGDTLWDISAKFLKSPWLWPELWRANDDHIKNPHLIYPGDVVFLIMTPDGPRLSRIETVKLTPSIHSEAIVSKDAIPTIPYATVRAFLRRPLMDNAEALAKAPRLIGSEDGRGLVSLGDRVYADSIAADTARWNIVRLGKSLKDPASGTELAREVEFVGDAKTLVRGGPATLEITGVEREIMLGDRLVPATDASTLDFVPHAPRQAIAGRIISAFGASQISSRYTTVIIDQGRAHGLEPGHVLAIAHPGKTLGRPEGESRTASFNPKSGYLDSAKERGQVNAYGVFDGAEQADERQRWLYKDTKCLKADAPAVLDSTYDPAKVMEECKGEPGERRWAYLDIGCLKPGKQVTYGEPFDPKEVYEPHCRSAAEPAPATTRLPDVRAGLVLVYRVFDKVSYALVMESYSPIFLLDTVSNP